jgi:hypothetical protein
MAKIDRSQVFDLAADTLGRQWRWLRASNEQRSKATLEKSGRRGAISTVSPYTRFRFWTLNKKRRSQKSV